MPNEKHAKIPSFRLEDVFRQLRTINPTCISGMTPTYPSTCTIIFLGFLCRYRGWWQLRTTTWEIATHCEQSSRGGLECNGASLLQSKVHPNPTFLQQHHLTLGIYFIQCSPFTGSPLHDLSCSLAHYRSLSNLALSMTRLVQLNSALVNLSEILKL